VIITFFFDFNFRLHVIFIFFGGSFSLFFSTSIFDFTSFLFFIWVHFHFFFHFNFRLHVICIFFGFHFHFFCSTSIYDFTAFYFFLSFIFTFFSTSIFDFKSFLFLLAFIFTLFFTIFDFTSFVSVSLRLSRSFSPSVSLSHSGYPCPTLSPR